MWPRATTLQRFGIVYLVALIVAEIITTFGDPRLGVGLHAFLFILLTIQATRVTESWVSTHSGVFPARAANFYIALALLPLIRIVSLAMPLGQFRQLAWYGLVAIPILGAAWTVIEVSGYNRREIGLCVTRSWSNFTINILFSLTGIGFGYLEYRILMPDPVIPALHLLPTIAAFLILLIGTGLMEELVFRGILQRASDRIFGSTASLLYVSTAFSALHIGHRSALDIVFVFGVALLFGWFVRRTGSLLGVSLAHGLTNFCLFVFFPLLLQPTTPSIVTIPSTTSNTIVAQSEVETGSGVIDEFVVTLTTDRQERNKTNLSQSPGR